MKKILALGIISMFLLTGLTALSAVSALQTKMVSSDEDGLNFWRRDVIYEPDPSEQNKELLSACMPINKEKADVTNYLQKGDILFCDIKLEALGRFGNSNDHCALCIDDNGNRFIHAIPGDGNIVGGVKIWTKLEMEQCFENIVYAKVLCEDDKREAAVDWILERENSPYQSNYDEPANPDPDDDSDPLSDHWYCSELVWAAYWHQDVDLSSDYWKPGGVVYIFFLLGSDKLIMDNILPSAKIDIFDEYYSSNGVIALCGGSSVDPDGFPDDQNDLVYYWDYTNDGIWDEIGSVYDNVQCVLCDSYEEGKTYKVKLQVEDVNGGIDNTTKTFTVGDDNSHSKTAYPILSNILSKILENRPILQLLAKRLLGL